MAAVLAIDAALLADSRRAGMNGLLGVTVVGTPLMLAFAVAAGYGVSYFALRPVETMRDRLGSALERERALVADASHELRAPLAVAQAEVDLALRPGRSPAEMTEALGSVGEEIDRLERLCDDLLLLARADRQELAVVSRRVSIQELLGRLGERMRRTAGGGVEVDLSSLTDVDVEVDPLRIEQAVSNLVANSLRYGAGNVRLWASHDGDGTVRLHVSDDGPGFPEDFLPRAFDRFARGHEGASPRGSGLGLAIVATIARVHGGDAGAVNLPGGGADVWIALTPAR